MVTTNYNKHGFQVRRDLDISESQALMRDQQSITNLNQISNQLALNLSIEAIEKRILLLINTSLEQFGIFNFKDSCIEETIINVYIYIALKQIRAFNDCRLLEKINKIITKKQNIQKQYKKLKKYIMQKNLTHFNLVYSRVSYLLSFTRWLSIANWLPRMLEGLPITDNFDIKNDRLYHIQMAEYNICDKFITSDSLNLRKYLKYIKTLSRGDLYKSVKEVLKNIKNWQRTFERSEFKHYKKFCELLKSLGLKNSNVFQYNKTQYQKQKFVPQLFEDIRKAAAGIRTTAEIFQQTQPVLTDTLEEVRNAAVGMRTATECILDRSATALNSLGPTLDTMSNTAIAFQGFLNKMEHLLGGSSIALKIVSLINKAYLFVSCVYQKLGVPMIVSSLYNMVEGLVPSSYLSDIIQIFVDGSIRASKTILNKFIPQQDEPVNENSFLFATCSAIYTAIKSVILPITKDDFFLFNINVKKISALALLLRSTTTIYDYFISMVDWILRLTMKHVEKTVGYVPKFWLNSNELEELYADLKYIEQNDIVTQSMISTAASRFIISYREKLNKFLTTSKNHSVNKLVLMHLSHIKREVENWYKAIPPYLREVPGSDRVRPIWIYIYGRPRIGKTTVVAKSLVYACAKTMKLMTEQDKWDAFVHPRSLGEPYWEGYNGHPVVSYTDIFQTIKDDQALDLAITELTRINDGNAYTLPMAFDGPKGKGKNFFTSKLVVSDAQNEIGNQEWFRDRCWSQGTHITARRSLVIEVLLNPIYAGPNHFGINYDKFEEQYKQDNFIFTREQPIAPKDAYIFKIWHPTTNAIIKTFTDYMEFVTWVATYCKDLQDKNFKTSDGVDQFCKSLFQTQVDEPFIDPNYMREAAMRRRDLGTFVPQINDSAQEHIPLHGRIGRHLARPEMQEEVFYPAVDRMYRQLRLDFKSSLVAWRAAYGIVKQDAIDKISNFSQTKVYLTFMTLSGLLTAYGMYKLLFNMPATKKQQKKQRKEEAQKFYRENSVKNNQCAQCHLECQDPIIAPNIQTHETKEPKVVVRRTRQNRIIKPVIQGLESNTLNTMTTMHNCMCRFVLHIVVKKKSYIVAAESAFNIGGSVFVAPRHYWQRVIEYRGCGKAVELYIYWPSKDADKIALVDYDNVEVFPEELMWEHARDLIYLNIKNFRCGKDLSSKFPSLGEISNLSSCLLYGIRSDSHVCNGNCTHIYGGTRLRIESIPIIKTELRVSEPMELETPAIYNKPLSINIKAKPFMLTDYYVYGNADTVAGDCGMLLINTNVRSEVVILGMHTAGSANKYGIACPIFKEDIIDVFKYFKPIVKDATLKYSDQKGILTPFSIQLQERDVNIEGILACRQFENKLVNYKVNMPNKSKLHKSIVYDFMEEDFGPALTAPAKLNKETIDGVVNSPILNGISKLRKVTNQIPKDEFLIIKDHVINTIMSWDSWALRNDPRVLTYTEAINGIEGLRQVDITTSAGFPFIRQNSKTDKTPLLNITLRSDQSKFLEPTPYLISIIEERIDAAKLNVIAPTYYVDTLKDETRPLAKVKAFKTRVFQVTPFDLTVALRMYFGFFISHCQSTFNEGEIAIGINPDSYDWTISLKRMLRVSKKFVSGDFSDFDASILPELGDIVADAANTFYNDSEENQRIRRVLMATMFSGTHVIDCIIHSLYQGNPSGGAMTSILNCIENMVLWRFCYIRTVETSLYRYNLLVAGWFYGDDSLLAICETIISKFNMFSFQQTCLLLGKTFTTSDKHDITRPYFDLSEITFLKRRFVWDEQLNLYKAPIDLDVISELPRWSMGDVFSVLDQTARFNQSLLFASSHSAELHEKYYSKFKEYCHELSAGAIENNGKKVYLSFDANKLFTYDVCLETLYPERVIPPANRLRICGRNSEVVSLVDTLRHELKLDLPSGFNSLDPDCNKTANKEQTNMSLLDALNNLAGMVPQTHETKEIKIRVNRTRQARKVFKPQMDQSISEQASLEENMSKNIIPETVTTFTDFNARHNPDLEVVGENFNDTMPRVDLDMYIRRPLALLKIPWASSDALGAQLGTLNFPTDQFTTAYRAKIQQTAFWRPDVELTFRLNGTPMHYGKLVVAWIPQGNALNPAFFNDFRTMYGNNWTQISANSNQPVTLEIPYTHYKEAISVGAQSESLFTLWIYVAVPLASVNGTAPSLELTVYSRVINPRLTGYAYTTNFASQMDSTVRKANTNKIQKDTDGEALRESRGDQVISSSVTNLGKAISNFRWVPSIGRVIEPIGRGVVQVGNILKYFGMSVSPNLNTTQPMQFRQPRFLQYEDQPTTLVIGPTPDGKTEIDYSLVNDVVESNSIVRFCQRPGLLYVGNITSANIPGDNLYSKFIRPVDMFSSTYLVGYSPTSIVLTPMAYMTKFHKFWRGSVRIHINFVCSAFHSCRVRIWYNPYYAGTNAVIPVVTEANTTDMINTVLDITKETNYSFSIPYMQQAEWLTVLTGNETASSPKSNGAFGIQLINNLTSGAASVSTIYYQIFISAGEDYQLAGLNSTIGNNNYGHFVPQTDFTITECLIPSSSMRCLMSSDYPPIGNVGKGRVTHKVYNAAETTSVKQLTNLLSPVATAIPATASFGVHVVSPTGNWAQYYVGGGLYNYMLSVAPVFRYWRGGMRMAARCRDFDMTVQVDTSFSSSTGVNFIQSLVSAPADYNGTVSSQTGNASFIKIGHNPVDFVVPYFSNYKCWPVKFSPPAAGNFNLTDMLAASINYFPTIPLNTIPVSLSLSGADDFILGFQIGPPVLSTTLPS